MSSASIWSRAPKTVREVQKTTVSTITMDVNNITVSTVHNPKTRENLKINEEKTSNIQQKQELLPLVVQPGQKCKHGKWQPEPAETIRANTWTCYECTFICSICGLNSVGLCDSYDCRNV